MFDRVKTAWTNTHLKKSVFAEDIRVLTRHARFIVIIYFNFFIFFINFFYFFIDFSDFLGFFLNFFFESSA